VPRVDDQPGAIDIDDVHHVQLTAEEDESGLAGLCGTVTPNVVPRDTTMNVTFLLPPKRVRSCWIWVNPVPGAGGSLFQTSGSPLKGEIFITADGQSGWLSP
jgi:hypothetical protein